MTVTKRAAICHTACIVLAAVCFGVSDARAGGSAETFGHDVRSQGKGNAVVADDTATAAAFVNPAALARLKRPTLLVGMQLSMPHLTVTLENERPGGDRLAPAVVAPVAGLNVAFATPLSLFVDDRIFIGISAFFPSVVLVRARAWDPARPYFYRYDSSTDYYEAFLSVGVRLFDWAALGAGLRLGAGQGGATNVSMDPVRGRFTRQELDTNQHSVVHPIVGLLLGPIGVDAVRGRIGFAFREKSTFVVALPAELAIDGLDTSLLLELLNFANFCPRTWTVGTTVQLFDVLDVSADVQYAQWSEAPPPFLQVQNTIAGDGLDRLGLGGSLDAPAEGQNRVVSPGFVDTVNVRVGIEGRLFDDALLLRTGYQWRPTPVPDQTSGTNIVDNTAHIVSAGATTRFLLPMMAKQPFFLDAAYQAQILAPRATAKASARDPIGSWTSSGVVHLTSLAIRYAW